MYDYDKLDNELIISIANNANLNFNNEELSSLIKDIKSILEAFSILNSIDISKEEPYYYPYPIIDIYREDVEENTVWDQLSNSENNEKGYIKGPKLV